MKKLRHFLAHPRTQLFRRIVRRTLAVASVILAVVFVLTLTMDLGPYLRERAESAGSAFLKRPMTIGELGIRLWNGKYVVRDLEIAGLTPESRPWLTAREILVSMQWRPLVNREIVLDEIEMTDWAMYVELTRDGRHSFPDFNRGDGGERPVTTTLKYVRAQRGEFTFDDQAAPWSVVARNIDVTVARPNSEYRGSARFSNGRVAIQEFVPFRADMDTTFKIDGGRVIFDAIHLTTDGTTSVLKGDVDLSHWPEQMYSVKSTIDLPSMRQLFFADDDFELAGTAEFDGSFHLFKGEVRPDGSTAGGRELKGRFHAPAMYVNDYRLDGVRGDVRWLPRSLDVHDATAAVFGGRAEFEYSMAPLGVAGVTPTNRFDATHTNVDLAALADFFELQGLRLAGTLSGRNVIEWPSGRFAERTWTGDARSDPPGGTRLMTRDMPLEEINARDPRSQRPGEFSPHLPKAPIPLGGEISYALGPEWIEVRAGRIATPSTYLEIEGVTAYGERSRMPFHVSSADWQESDRIFAGVLTAFGSRTRAIPVDGYGTFDGVMLGAFRQPRIEGRFAGERIRAFDVTWGSVDGDAVIENAYADVTGVRVASGDSTMTVNGTFSLGYPRRDGGEQINARIAIAGRPVADLKHAFGIDEYDVDGTLSGTFEVAGEYERPFGSGTMAIRDGTAYGETFDSATADVRLEGDGVRLANIALVKGAGGGSGFASIQWDGSYSFNFTANNIAVESLTLTEASTLPLSGIIDFTAGGNGTFDMPRYDVRGTIRDFFVADEGIGRVLGDLSIEDDLMTMRLEATSPRLEVSGSGTIRLDDTMDTNLRFSVSDTSLDPYIRAFEPRLSPYTTAIASGTLRVAGELGNLDNMVVEASVDRFDAWLFDYLIRNPDNPKTPGQRQALRLVLDRNSVRIVDVRLEGDGTVLDIGGTVDLRNETIAMRFGGGANLQILEGFTRNVRSVGRAEVKAALAGPIREPMLSGSMTVADGRIRHFSLPHALDDINGVISFDSRGINLDEVTADIGGGPVTFGGSIGIDGYRLGRVDVAMSGENMGLRYPQGGAWLRATVDAPQLSLEGTPEALTLSGDVLVRQATYTKEFVEGGSLFDFGQSDSAALPGSSVAAPTLPLSYAINIRAPSTIRARNSLLQQVVARGDVTLVGTFERPGLRGTIDVERGDVLFQGKRYQIRQATLSFNNPNAIEPFFDLEAETRVRVPGETYRVTIRASGLDPFRTMTFTSDPPLPEYELLALLFSDIAPDRDVEFRQYQAGVTAQEQLLQQALTRALASPVSSEINRALQEALAVDAFQITPSLLDPNREFTRLDPAARVTILKRINERTYLTYSRSLASTTRDQVIVLEIDQTDRLSWILSRNEDGTYALDLRVRRSF